MKYLWRCESAFIKMIEPIFIWFPAGIDLHREKILLIFPAYASPLRSLPLSLARSFRSYVSARYSAVREARRDENRADAPKTWQEISANRVRALSQSYSPCRKYGGKIKTACRDIMGEIKSPGRASRLFSETVEIPF